MGLPKSPADRPGLGRTPWISRPEQALEKPLVKGARWSEQSFTAVANEHPIEHPNLIPSRDIYNFYNITDYFQIVNLKQQIDVTAFHQFGSDKILKVRWTPEQLRGHAMDKRIISRKHRPDHSPPLRQQPYHNPKPLAKHLWGSIRAIKVMDPQKKLLALTFDLCEGASEITGYDAELVNYLRDHEIRATFYAGGKWMRSHPEPTKQLMADPRFEIGNHAWSHGNLRMLTAAEMQKQVLWTQAQYELLREDLAAELLRYGIPAWEMDKIPPIPLSFRYPYGACNQAALNFMARYGLPSVQWNIVTADPWPRQTADGIVKTVLRNVKPGSIIIAHANGRGWKTTEALTKLVPALRAQGYRFVTVTELLAEGQEVEAVDACYELRLGDNQIYDKTVGKGLK